MSEQITKEEFVRRFTERLVARVGETDANGDSVREIAAQAAPTYYDDNDYRECGPEECADADLDEWEPAQ